MFLETSHLNFDWSFDVFCFLIYYSFVLSLMIKELTKQWCDFASD